MKFLELKQHIKNLAQEIKEKKKQRKTSTYGYVSGLDNLRYEVRHHHIAYCLLRGRTIEEIERSTRDDNQRDVQYYTKIKNSIAPREIVNTSFSNKEVGYAEAVCCG